MVIEEITPETDYDYNFDEEHCSLDESRLPPASYHCQYCEKDLTTIGGLVSDNGGIYCSETCLFETIFKQKKSMLYIDYPAKELPRLVLNGILTHFSKLEKSSSSR